MSTQGATKNLRDQQQRFEAGLARYFRGKGLVSEAELQEALTQQIIMGGQLGTALWELGLVPGKTLQAVTAGLLKLPSVDPATIQTIPHGILAKLDRDFVARTRILPFSVAGKVLRVATCEPWNLKALDEAAFLSGLRLELYALVEVPLVRLIEKNYGVKAGPRFRMQPQLRVRTTAATTPAPQTAADIGELMGEDTFEEMYAGRAHGAPATVEVPTAPPTPDAEDLEVVEVVEGIGEAADHGPLDRKVAIERLQEATDRDGIALVLARVALKVGRRVVLFSRQGDLWMGWTGVGQGISSAAVQALMIPSAKGTAFGLVHQTESHFLGPLAPNPVHDQFLKALGGGRPVTCGIFPVWFKGRIVFGIYIDNGDGQAIVPDIGDLLIVAQQVAAALERLIKARAGQAG